MLSEPKICVICNELTKDFMRVHSKICNGCHSKETDGKWCYDCKQKLSFNDFKHGRNICQPCYQRNNRGTKKPYGARIEVVKKQYNQLIGEYAMSIFKSCYYETKRDGKPIYLERLYRMCLNDETIYITDVNGRERECKLQKGDYVIQIQGKHYPCLKEVFKSIYQLSKLKRNYSVIYDA